MYCSLQEAWPNIHNKALNYSSNTKYNIEYFNNDNCKNILEHINNCPSCRLKFIKHKNDIFSFLDLNPENKETIIVFLIGVMIILLLNLLIK